MGLPIVVGSGGSHLAQVLPRGEGARSAGDDGHSNRVVGPGVRQGIAEIIVLLVVEGVALVGPVQREQSHAVPVFGEDCRSIHLETSNSHT